VNQTSSSFNLPSNFKTGSFGITPYSATLNCGSLSNTWTYSGLDMADGLKVDASANSITVNPSSGAITVS
jgi:hypothetical protein